MELFTPSEHPNTLAPLADGALWAVLHNLGQVRPPVVRWRPASRTQAQLLDDSFDACGVFVI
jgi:hypothetical protein